MTLRGPRRDRGMMEYFAIKTSSTKVADWWHRHYVEKMKEEHTIAGWEQGLRQWDGESTEDYTARLTDALGVLDEFYNNMEMKSRRFMVKKYQKAIFDVVTDNILRTVGENIGRKVSKGKKIGVAIGAGGFNRWSSFERLLCARWTPWDTTSS